MSTYQQWSGHENSRGGGSREAIQEAGYQQWSSYYKSRGGGSRSNVDPIADLYAKAAKLEESLQEVLINRNMRAVGTHQPQPCAMCGDWGHSYEYCPLAYWDEESDQVNYHSFYNNEPFDNSHNHAFQSYPPEPYNDPPEPYIDPPEPYIDPAVSNEQMKMSLMIEQMQIMQAEADARAKRINTLMDHLLAKVETSESEPMHGVDVTTVDLGEPGRDPHESDASRVPQPEDLEIGESESDEADARSAREPSATDATHVEPDAICVEPDATHDKAQPEAPTPTPELKPLPAILRYDFLGPDISFLVVISADLEPDRTTTLLEKLKTRTGEIRCSTTDSKEFLWILLIQEFDRTVRVPQKWVLPPVPPDPPPTEA